MKAIKVRRVAEEKKTGWALFTLVLAAVASVPVIATPPTDIPYPSGYRTWVHVKTVLVGPKSPAFESGGGIHHVYANDKAMEGLRIGAFADGSMLVFDLLEAKEKGGITTEGPRQRIDFMLKDSKHFSEAGGWGFERFLGDSETNRPLTEEQRKACFSCHEQRKEHGFVFSEFRK